MVGRFRIRAATPADLERVAAIERTVFSDPWPASAFGSLLGEDALVLELDGQVEGYVFARRMGQEAEILNLAVRPERQGAGLGRSLLDAALAQLLDRGVSQVFLEVRCSNTGAQAFYHRMGFESAGVRRGYYSQPVEDAFVLRRDLGSDSRE
ncbi:MAG: ribosomal protein S18-alanine N-acetyltransferase [Gemmatimonadetes bacterium]|jgi:ribosomal-protein-alanine N-acetyltransferase|nr:ribosomal protein S18-alanine N-acetyltransferase [Gemmatimonadota bacterium]